MQQASSAKGPPDSYASAFVRESLLQEKFADKVRCGICERRCQPRPDALGWCRTRQNRAVQKGLSVAEITSGKRHKSQGVPRIYLRQVCSGQFAPRIAERPHTSLHWNGPFNPA